MEDEGFNVTGESMMTTKQVLERIKSTKELLIKRIEEKGLDPVEMPPLFAPSEVWAMRQAAIDAEDWARAAYIEMVIYAANGY